PNRRIQQSELPRTPLLPPSLAQGWAFAATIESRPQAPRQRSTGTPVAGPPILRLFQDQNRTSPLAPKVLLDGVEVRKLLAKMSNFRRIVVHDVWAVVLVRGIVLLVGLGWIKILQWNYLGHDRALEDLGFFELCDIRLGDPLLVVGAIENGRTILGAFVGALPVQLRGIVGHREE